MVAASLGGITWHLVRLLQISILFESYYDVYIRLKFRFSRSGHESLCSYLSHYSFSRQNILFC